MLYNALDWCTCTRMVLRRFHRWCDYQETTTYRSAAYDVSSWTVAEELITTDTMAAGHVYKILFFMQSAAFIMFIMSYSKFSNIVYTPDRRYGVCKCKEYNATNAAACSGMPARTRGLSTNLSHDSNDARREHTKGALSAGITARGSLSNCSLADIKKRPGVVLLTTSNLAFVDVVLNMLESIKRIGICVNTSVIAEDQKAYDLLYTRAEGDPAVQVFKTNSGEMDVIEHSRRHGSQYYGIMNKRAAYVVALLERGLEVLFSDADTFWFRDPFPYFEGDFDMYLRGSHYPTRVQKKTEMCAGFIYFKPTNVTLQFARTYSQILVANKEKGKFTPDQSVMNGLLKGDKPVHVNVKLLDPNLFPWGPTFFNPSWQKQKHPTVVMHAASIRGHGKKLEKFKEFGLWLFNSTSSPILD